MNIMYKNNFFSLTNNKHLDHKHANIFSLIRLDKLLSMPINVSPYIFHIFELWITCGQLVYL